MDVTTFSLILENTTRQVHDASLAIDVTEGMTRYQTKTWESVFMWIIVICIITFNIPVFIIVPKMKCLLPVSRWGMLSLALADFCQGCLSLVRFTYFFLTNRQDIPSTSAFCHLDGFATSYFACVSIITLTFLALDRQFIIKSSFQYKHYITGMRAVAIQILIWTFAFILMSPFPFELFSANVVFSAAAHLCIPDFTLNLVLTGFVLFFVLVLPTCLLLQSFVALFRIAHRQNQQISNQEAQVCESGCTNFNKREAHIIRTLFFMTMGYYIFWTPYFVFVNIWELISGHTLHPVLDFLFIWFGGISSFVNPLVYIPTMKEYRVNLLSLLHLHKLAPDSKDEQSSHNTLSTLVI